jgi:hypothetical protein
MKNITVVALLILSFNAFGQSPTGMNYQGVVRDANDDVVVNQQISIRISIIKDNLFGASVYVETHSPTTNSNGLFSLHIGDGAVSFGNFSNIAWGSNTYFLKTEVDITGSTNYLPLSTSEFMSVPYAYYSDSTGNVDDADADPSNELNQAIGLTGTILSLTDAGGVLTQDLSSIQDGYIDADADTTNELNQALGLTGTMLSLTDAGGVLTQDLSSIQDGYIDDDADTTNELNRGFNLVGTILSVTDAGGTLSQDLNSVLMWDSIGSSIHNMNSGNVGIGTTIPSSKVHIRQDSISNALLIERIGNQVYGDSSALTILNSSSSAAQSIIMNDTSTWEPALKLKHRGFGSPIQARISNRYNPYAGLYVNHGGVGSGIYLKNTPFSTDSIQTDYRPLLDILQNGSGTAGQGIRLEMGDTTTATSFMIRHRGHNPFPASYGYTARGKELQILDTNNRSIGSAIFSLGKGLGQYIRMFNDNNGALEIFQNGSGKGINVILSDTTSQSQAVYVWNESNGSAIEVMNFGGGDPIRSTSVNPSNSTSPSITGIASNGTSGVGVEGNGGRYGVHGNATNSNSSTYGVYASGDLAATGVKSFVIDHPMDPLNKTLRHYSIESNEVLNMYRGIVVLDESGQGKIELPEYWDVTNINPSYQLTAIGSPTQPYILQEIKDNYFIVAGEPLTKVSWTVYSNRNDPTFRYYDSHGKEYSKEVIEKTPDEKGTYRVPEAYGEKSRFQVPKPNKNAEFINESWTRDENTEK